MMSTETTRQWLTVHQSDINKPKTKTQDGIKIQFMLSPSDIPTAWREYRDKSNGTHGFHVIEFKYLASAEPTQIIAHSNEVQMEIGKSSKRVYKIKINLDEVLKKINSHEIESENPKKETESNRNIEAEEKTEYEISTTTDKLVAEELKALGDVGSGNADAIQRIVKPKRKNKSK